MTRNECVKVMAAMGDTKCAYTKISRHRMRVTILRFDSDDQTVIVLSPAGNELRRTPRQLSQSDSDAKVAVPPIDRPQYAGELTVTEVQSGQTIDMGDTLITTTLHRLATTLHRLG